MKKYLVLIFFLLTFLNFNLFASFSFFFGQSDLKSAISYDGYKDKIEKGYLAGINIDIISLPLKDFYFSSKLYLFTTDEIKSSREYESGFVSNDFKKDPYYNQITLKHKCRLIPILFGLDYNKSIFNKIIFNAGIFTGFGIISMEKKREIKEWDWAYNFGHSTGSGLIKQNEKTEKFFNTKGVGIIECNLGFDYEIYENTAIGLSYVYRFTTAPSIDDKKIDFSGTSLIFNIRFLYS